MNLVNYLANRADEHPDRVALISADTSISYAELYARVCHGAKILKRDGLGKGDTVLILQPVSIPLYISLLAAFHAGLTVMFVDPSAGKEMLRQCLHIHPPTAFIGIAKAHLLRLTIPGIRRIPHRYHSNGFAPFSRHWNPTGTSPFPPIETAPEDPALITFTSGSTGMPKAACRTHGFLLAQHEALAESLDYQDGEVDLVTLPIFTLANLASGLTSVLADTDLRYPARADSVAIAQQCQEHQVTRCAASPAFFSKLLKDGQLPPFKALYTGGAPVFPHLLEKLQTALPHSDIVTVYGSTEAEPISHITWQQTTHEDRQNMRSGRGLLVGQAVDATQLKIITDQSGCSIAKLSENELADAELPTGEIGEIIVTGAHVLRGYLHGHGDTENKIHVRETVWHRTGDAGWRDEQGRVWLMGRCSAAIHRPNQAPLYPFGIECAAMTHPAVHRAALIEHNERIVLLIEGNIAAGTIDDLRRILPENSFDKIHQTKSIPMDRRHNAKVDYVALKKQLVQNSN